MKKYILGIKIDDVTMEEAVQTVNSWLSRNGKSFDKTQDKHYIVTPNPEFLLTAQSDEQFKKILNSADLAIPDGMGLKLAGVENTVAGVDLMEKLVALAQEKAFTIGLLGGRKEIAERTAECLVGKYPKLKISFADDGGRWNIEDGNLKMDILFVAFGHPKQEKWISQNLDKIPVKVTMGVGGAFDYISGKIPRAPEWLRKLGMEWLFRLAVQPWRIKRQLKLLKYVYLLAKS